MTESTWYFPYELQPLSRLSARTGAAPRHGALLRTGGGFADLHPWPELGDLPLERQLEFLRRDELTPLTEASLRLASVDAAARREKVSLFEGLEIPPSHHLIPDLDSPIDVARIARSGFDLVKIKMGRDLKAETGKLQNLLPAIRQTHLRFRIDFNASLDEKQIDSVLESFDRDRIDFLEDPFPYHPSLWSKVSDRYQVRLAADRPDPEKLAEGVAVIVWKPALRDEHRVFEAATRIGASVVVTSNMDHPVGQMGAALAAARNAARVGTCGLLTHTAYAPNDFSRRVSAHGPRLAPPKGMGIGFDDLLDALPWRKLT